MHPDDLRLLREIEAAGARGKAFAQRQGQSYEDYEIEVLRLLQLQKQDLISMYPEPLRSSRGDGQIRKTGVCRLTLNGRTAVAHHAG